jgi:OmpA-OmpF porin, OOP family
MIPLWWVTACFPLYGCPGVFRCPGLPCVEKTLMYNTKVSTDHAFKLLACALICGLALTTPHARAADAPSGADSYIGVFADALVLPDPGHVPELDGGWGLEGRYGVIKTEHWGYEVRLGYALIEPADNRAMAAMDGVYRLPLGSITLLGFAGGGLVYSRLGGSVEGGLLLNVGAGVATAPLFDLFDRPVRLRAEAREGYEQYSESFFDLHAYLGLEMPLANAPPPMPPPAPEPVAVVAPDEPADTDADGVVDSKDRCPDTKAGVRVDAEGCEILKVLTLKGVNFALDSDQLSAESYPVLDEAVARLKTEFSDVRIEVAGHTDATGEDDYNLDLSQRRANTVMGYLVEAGVDASRLTATGFGEGEPVAGNETLDGRARNRRVELRVKGQ